MNTRTLLVVASHLLAGALGAMVAVWWLVDDLRRASATASDMMLASRYATYVELQRTEGSVDEYRDALVAYLAALDQLRASEGAFFSEKMLSTDRMFAHVRLARLEEQTGNRAKAADHMKQARAACERIPWSNCDADHLVGVVQRIEKNSVFGPKGEAG